MTKSADRAAKLGSMSFDDTPPSSTKELLQQPAKTAPGQMMVFGEKLRIAEERVAELEGQLDTAAPRKIPLKEIYLVEGRKRRLTSEQRQELKSNLEQNPLLHPVTVLPRNGRGYELVSGYNRYEIYEELGRPEIDAFVVELDAAKVENYAFYANLLAPSLPDFEKYLGFKKRQRDSGLMQKQLAEESGISLKALSRLFCFDDFPQEAIDLLKQAPDVLGGNSAQAIAAAFAAGKTKRALEAVQRLVDREEGFTQAKAVAWAKTVETEKVLKKPARVIKEGAAHYCKMEARKNVIAVQFKDDATAAEWLDKFEQFMRSQLRADR